MPTISVAELATLVGGTVVGDANRVLSSCNSLMEATADQVSLFHLSKYAKELETTRAGCILTAPGLLANVQRADGLPPLTAIETKNTYYAWQQAMVKLHGHRTHAAVGISPLAVISKSATLGNNVHVHPFAVIGDNVTIGDNVHIYSHVTIMHDSRVGNDCVLYPNVTLYEACTIGNRCHINASTVVGSDGFAYAQANGIHHKMPQHGGIILEDDIEVGCHSVLERGALAPTRIGRGTKIGGHVFIGHNCQIGPGNVIISATCISGSTTTGKYVVIAGQVGVAGHLDIPDFVKVGAQSGVMTNPEPNTEIVGTPALEAGHAKRIKELERQLAKLQPDKSSSP